MKRRAKIKDFSRAVGILQKGGHYFPSNDRSQEKVNRVAEEDRGLEHATVRDLLHKTFWDKSEFSLVKQTLEAHGLNVVLMYSPLNR